MTTYKAVLLDFDGVLAHTIPIYKQAIFTFFKQKQLAVSENDFEKDGWASKSLMQLCEILDSKYDIQLSVDEIKKQIWQTQVDLINAGLESDPTLIPFLEFCQATGKKIAIGSNSGKARIIWVIEKMGIQKYFLYDQKNPQKGYNIVSADEVKNHKPDPEVWMKCSEMIEVPIESCLVIEDGLPGLTGAKKCGAQTIYYHRFCEPEKACKELAEKSVESFSELLN